MASTGGVNFVRFFFYLGNAIPRQRQTALTALAYATARDKHLVSKEILIRADIHDTTTVNGKTQKDPKTWHATLSFKDSEQAERKFHVTSHGYTFGKNNSTLREATHTPEKKDSTRRRGRGGKVVWPHRDKLQEFEDSPIAYSHMPMEEASSDPLVVRSP